MKRKNHTNHFPVSVIMLFIGFGLLTNCRSNEADKSDRESLKMDQKQQRQLLQEREDTTINQPPIFEAALKETHEAEGDTEARGSVTLTLQGDSIHIKGQFSGLSSDYTASYIHQALESERIQQLKPAVSGDKTSGSWESSYKLDEGEISMLKKDSLYISVHSTKYESGELRGQLTPKEDDDNDNN